MNDDQVLGWAVLFGFQIAVGAVVLNCYVSWGGLGAFWSFAVAEAFMLSCFTAAMVGNSEHGRGPLRCWKYLFTGR